MSTTTGQDAGTSGAKALLATMNLVREYAKTVGLAPFDEQVEAYGAVQAAVANLVALAYPEPKPAGAWAVLDANDRVRLIMSDRDEAVRTAGPADGYHARPLVLADLDDVADETPGGAA